MVTPALNSNCASFLQVKYRMDGDIAKTICHVDEKAKDIEHAKKVSQQVSKVRSWDDWLDRKESVYCLRGGLRTGLTLLASPTVSQAL